MGRQLGLPVTIQKIDHISYHKLGIKLTISFTQGEKGIGKREKARAAKEADKLGAKQRAKIVSKETISTSESESDTSRKSRSRSRSGSGSRSGGSRSPPANKGRKRIMSASDSDRYSFLRFYLTNIFLFVNCPTDGQRSLLLTRRNEYWSLL